MNLELVEQIVTLMGEHSLSEITVEQDGQRVHVCRPLLPPVPETAAPGPALEATVSASDERAKEETAEEARTLSAPMVGIFHHLAPPVPYAALLQAGQVVGSIESMKLMNDVAAEFGGRVVEVLVEDGGPVEYGQALFRLAAE